LNHLKKTEADGSRLILRKHTETLVLLSVRYPLLRHDYSNVLTNTDLFASIPTRWHACLQNYRSSLGVRAKLTALRAH